MTIHKLSMTDELNDLRFACKTMASLILLRRDTRYGRFPLKTLSRKVYEGTVSLHELNEWHPRATQFLKKGV